MQAPGSLSAPQRNSLEAAYTFFVGVKPFLQSIESRLRPDERLQAINLLDLAELSQSKLVEAFPELHTWLAEWTHDEGVLDTRPARARPIHLPEFIAKKRGKS